MRSERVLARKLRPWILLGWRWPPHIEANVNFFAERRAAAHPANWSMRAQASKY